MSQIVSTTKILDVPEDWDSWFFIVKSMATGGRTDVWKYVNPDLPAEPAIPKLEDPPNADTYATLSADDKKTFKFSYQLWKDRMTRVTKTREVLELLQIHITKTVSTRNIIYIRDCTTSWQMLVALKKRLAPTNRARELEVIRRYIKLKQFTKREPPEQWLRSWEETYSEAKRLNLPDVDKNRATYDFLQAIYPIDPAFASANEVHFSKATEIPNVLDLIEEFRNHLRLHEVKTNLSDAYSAFSTLQGVHQDGTQSQACVCGANHRWARCYYLIESIRPASWKEDEGIRKKIDKKLASDPKLKIAVEEKISWMKWKAEKENTKAEGTTQATNSNSLGSF
jgi:hypothetical protein